MKPADATATAPEGNAFLRAVSELGRRRPVVTSRAIFNDRGIKLLEGGVAIDGGLYDRLVTHRLANPLDECLDIEPSANGPAIRQAAEEALAHRPFFAQMVPAGRTRDMVLQAIEAIPLPRPLAFQLTLAKESRAPLFEHSVLTALLCAHLVREGGAPSHDITMAAAAGLLRDLGMLHVAPDLLAADHLITGDQRRPLYAHPVTSSVQVGRFRDYPKEVVRAVLEHHERMDGSGYPRGLAGEAISPLGRVLSLAEVVTAMFGSGRRNPQQRVSLLLRVSPRRYDPALVPSIHRLLRGVSAPPDVPEASDAALSESVGRLRQQIELLAQWRTAVGDLLPQIAPGPALLLGLVIEQTETLQRTLFDAGIDGTQLDLLVDDESTDAATRMELWALGQELQWQLRTTAHQLQRRWRAQADAPPLPAALNDWLQQVNALGLPG